MSCCSRELTVIVILLDEYAAGPRSFGERDAGGLAYDVPGFALLVPARDDRIRHVEPALRDFLEIEHAIDAGIVFQVRDEVVNLSGRRAGSQFAQRRDDDHRRIPGEL